MAITVTVRPRVETISWSLYWKDTLSVSTACLEEVQVELTNADTLEETSAADLLAATAQKLGWAPVEKLLRLDGFDLPWERLLFRGRELPLDAKLPSQAGEDGQFFVVVRRCLKADGWRVAQKDDFLLSSDDDDETV